MFVDLAVVAAGLLQCHRDSIHHNRAAALDPGDDLGRVVVFVGDDRFGPLAFQQSDRMWCYFNPMPSFLQRGIGRLRERMKRPVRHFNMYIPHVKDKAGLEIGGPSETFRARDILPIYQFVGSLDNCDFSSSTVWGEHAQRFHFLAEKAPGRSIFCDGSNLNPVASGTYDFVLSSHNLEHFANPVRALYEWKRVLRPGGAIILILPYYKSTFDHRRTPTPAAAMLDDFQRNIGEDDLSHLPEILEKHDLALDPGAGSLENFHKRSLDNVNNRCLHHHVFDQHNIRELLMSIKFEVLAVDLVLPMHICVLARV